LSAKTLNLDRFRVQLGQELDLEKIDPEDTSASPWSKKKVKDEEEERLDKKLDQLQEMLFAEHKHKLLVVLQAMDTGGKDGVIRRVFRGMSPAGVRVAHFRQPSQEEIDHGFIWRAYKQIPGDGEFVIFNRSHYEGVLVERVHNLVPRQVWERRYDEINEFEELLVSQGITVVKFFLHISSEEQKKRIEERLKDPTKEWKFSEDDIRERKKWDDYMKAYEDALKKTSTKDAPWYIVPSNHKWFRDVVVSTAIVATLESLDMHYPKLALNPGTIS
jgi:PPK2 family polyphosphate:nucleotide phosphotransferase